MTYTTIPASRLTPRTSEPGIRSAVIIEIEYQLDHEPRNVEERGRNDELNGRRAGIPGTPRPPVRSTSGDAEPSSVIARPR